MTQRKIYLLPMGIEDTQLMNRVAEAVNETFDLPVEQLPAIPMPEYTYNEDRGQYHSTAILKFLAQNVPEDALRVLAITDADLFIPQLNFVFGEAAIDGTVSIISLHRLHPEFYGEPTDKELFFERAIKEAIHELGHTFGLRHCLNPDCVMFFSNNIHDTDRKSTYLCGRCAEELQAKLKIIKSQSQAIRDNQTLV